MLINYESYIPVGSAIVGLTIQEVESKFDIRIDHYHNSSIEIDSKMPPSSDIILKSGMSIKICKADSEILAEFCRFFDLP